MRRQCMAAAAALLKRSWDDLLDDERSAFFGELDAAASQGLQRAPPGRCTLLAAAVEASSFVAGSHLIEPHHRPVWPCMPPHLQVQQRSNERSWS